MEQLNGIALLDLIFIAILVLSVVLGIMRGAIGEVLSLVGLVASVYLAFTFADSFSGHVIAPIIDSPSISYLVSFALIVITVLLTTAIVHKLCKRLLKVSGLSVLNRVLGAIFGTLRGALVCSVLVVMIGFIPNVSSKAWWYSSTMIPTFSKLGKETLKYVPEDVKTHLKQSTSQTSTIPIIINNG